jgi:tetratricopeptide (TPR) repeat protein
LTNELSPERARQVLDMLTAGGAMDGINTPLALRLIPLAKELGDSDLVDRLLDHASIVAEDDIERGWARFEGMKILNASINSLLVLAEEAETTDEGSPLAAAIHHHVALLHMSEETYDEARAIATRSLRLREQLQDLNGMAYGLALLMMIAKKQQDFDTAIALGTERLELVNKLGKPMVQMEAIAELAHCQATIGEFEVARELYNDSLERAVELGSISGQLVARWGLADLAEIGEDYETAMLVLSDLLHVYMAEDIPAPQQVKVRIEALTQLKRAPKGSGEGQE